jgi:ATP-dependent Clp protease protease subunit
MKSAVLKIYGDIGEQMPDSIFGEVAEMISAKSVSEFLDANTEATEITVRINSRGGDVQEGWAIHDLLVNSGKKITTIGEGKIYSIATILLLAGSDRLVMKNADGLIHNPFIPPYTLADQYESDDLEKIAESLRQEEEKILTFYSERTGTAIDILARYMKEETKLSAEDMLQLGFATKIIEPVKAYAYIKPKNNYVMDEKAFFEKLGSALDGAVLKMKNFSRINPTNQTLTDADGNEFSLEKETGEPAVGDAATPDGTYAMTDGKVIVVAGGVVTEVKEAEGENELEAAKKRIAELESQVEAFGVEKDALIKTEASFHKAEAEAKALIDELSNLKNSWKPVTRTKFSSTEKVGEVNMARVRELKEKLSNAKTE